MAALEPLRLKPFSDACERNRVPILALLDSVFRDRTAVLEIGSGTGQHAAHFAPQLPHLTWQPSDVARHLRGIAMWVDEAAVPNLRKPIVLDVDGVWPRLEVDAVYSANTCHIMSWPQVVRMFGGVRRLLPKAGIFAVYGPFSYCARHTSEGNARFDAILRAGDPQSGIRDFDAIAALAKREGLSVEDDHAMPANNRLLIFRA